MTGPGADELTFLDITASSDEAATRSMTWWGAPPSNASCR